MKKLFGFASLLLFLLTSGSAFAEQTLTQKGLLWQIDKSGLTSSYLLGTIHSEDKRVLKLLSTIRPHLKKADSVSLELLLDIPTILKSGNAMFFKGEESLDQLIDNALYTKIVKAMRPYQMPPMMVKKLKPWAVVATLSAPPPKTGIFLDLLLYREAQKLQIPVYGLEKVEEQLAVFENLSLDDQIALLKETVKHLDDMPKMFAKLHDLYLERNLTELMQFSIDYMRENSLDQILIDNFYKRIVDDRNQRMVKRMKKRLQEGNAFIAIGALHLPGKQGILKLLEKQGYKVSTVY
jgi:hypothetical protein